jgi:hypothetical protein
MIYLTVSNILDPANRPGDRREESGKEEKRDGGVGREGQRGESNYNGKNPRVVQGTFCRRVPCPPDQ